MENYEKLNEVLGKGTYGVVFKAKQKKTDMIVAIKKILMGEKKNGISFTALREIKHLQEFRHENVIRLCDVFVKNFNIHLVFEYMETDLEAVILDKNIILSPEHIKSYMKMLLQGVESCHKRWILHRDLKPSNLLISSTGILKLADFGFARQFGSPNPRYTHQVVTRWYRAPELLFGAKAYGVGVDMWGVGCIFAEMMLRRPYFAGESDIEQLSFIFAALGTPTEKEWPGMTSLPDYLAFNPSTGTPLKQLFTAASDDALNLLKRFLTFNPSARITATEALHHLYFQNEPKPTNPEELPKPAPKEKNMNPPDSPSRKRKLEQAEEIEAVKRKLF